MGKLLVRDLVDDLFDLTFFLLLDSNRHRADFVSGEVRSVQSKRLQMSELCPSVSLALSLALNFLLDLLQKLPLFFNLAREVG